MSGKYALIIGNTEYIDPGLAQLTAPGKDAEDFARVLKNQNICAFDDVKVLLNQLSSSAIEVIDEFFDQKKPDDLLVLYFSGHGVRDELGSLYLAFTNTIRSRLRSTAIKSDYIREAMDQSRSKRQVIILDCCNSGAFPQGTKAEVGGAMGMTQAFQGYGRFVLTASDATQFAWEGDKIIGKTDNSLFTHFLVQGLEGEADSDGDGRITVDELYDYAFHEISRATPKQTPTKSASKQEGEIVLRENMRIEDIKAVPLPTALLDSIENPFPDVRLGAAQQLTKLLNGKNLGLARSAKEALERIAENDDSRQVSRVAKQALEVIRQTEQMTEEEQKPREEPEHIVFQKAEEERLRREKADAELKAKEEAEQLAIQKAEEERIARARLEAEQEAKEERIAQKAELEAERYAEEKSLAKEKVAGKESKTTRPLWLKFGVIGGVIVTICLCGYATTRFLPSLFGGAATAAPSENGVRAAITPTKAFTPTNTHIIETATSLPAPTQAPTEALVAPTATNIVRLNNGDSYHFLSSTRGQYSGGDFYFYYENKDYFWANNRDQMGIIDLGDIGNVGLDQVNPPSAGYYQYGVEAIIGHTYVSLANASEKGHYIIFRVTDLKSGEYVVLEFYYL